jgi:SAM-dependent methyltransferase
VNSWDQHYQSGSSRDWAALLGADFLERLERAGAAEILDLGCGGGQDTLRMARFARRVTGVDFSAQAISMARALSAEAGIPVTFLELDIGGGLPFLDGSFDAVVSNLALHYFDRPTTERVFADVARVLKPGGLLLFHVNAREEGEARPEEREITPGLRVAPNGQLRRYFSRPDLEELLAGWEVLELEPVKAIDPNSGMILKHAWRAVARKA